MSRECVCVCEEGIKINEMKLILKETEEFNNNNIPKIVFFNRYFKQIPA